MRRVRPFMGRRWRARRPPSFAHIWIFSGELAGRPLPAGAWVFCPPLLIFSRVAGMNSALTHSSDNFRPLLGGEADGRSEEEGPQAQCRFHETDDPQLRSQRGDRLEGDAPDRSHQEAL